jgi:hypothetical protein
MGRVFNPKDRVEIVEYLQDKKAEYEQAKSDFVMQYSVYIQEQLDKVEVSAQNKGLDPTPIVKAVSDAQPSADYYKHKMDFSFLDLSIELDSEQWQELIDKINSDLKEKTIYELSRDAAEIRDMENPRTRAKKLLDLAERLESLDFYVRGLETVSEQIQEAVKVAGDVKPAKEYSQRESLMLSGVAKVLDENSGVAVRNPASLQIMIDAEATRIENLLAEEEGQSVIEEEEEPEAPALPQPEMPDSSQENDNQERSETEPETDTEEERVEHPPVMHTTPVVGAFSF